MQIVTLTTDFGLDDPYVPAMKGVVLSINPEAVLVDICHTIQPQNLAHASFVLEGACPYFPAGTIHLAVIDPGVGGARRALIIKTPGALYVGPDNGVLSHVLPSALREGVAGPEGGRVGLPPGFRAIELQNPAYQRHTVSKTFHGRDIFAPAAAHLSLGIPLEEFGPPVDEIMVLPLPRTVTVPPEAAAGPPGTTAAPFELAGQVVHVDRFGNLITNFRETDLALLGGGKYWVQIGGCAIDRIATTYVDAEIGEVVALMGSSGYLEISVRDGSAQAVLGAGTGTEVRVRTVS